MSAGDAGAAPTVQIYEKFRNIQRSLCELSYKFDYFLYQKGIKAKVPPWCAFKRGVAEISATKLAVATASCKYSRIYFRYFKILEFWAGILSV